MTKHLKKSFSIPYIPLYILERAIVLTQDYPGLELIDRAASPKIVPYHVVRADTNDYTATRAKTALLETPAPARDLVERIMLDASSLGGIPVYQVDESVPLEERPLFDSKLKGWKKIVTMPGEYRNIVVRWNEREIGVLFPERFVLNSGYTGRHNRPIPEVREIHCHLQGLYSYQPTS